MLSGRREGRARKVYTSTLIWGGICAIIIPVLFKWVNPDSLVSLPLVVATVVSSALLYWMGRDRRFSDAVFFRWMSFFFYFYSLQFVFHTYMNEFHILYFVSLLLCVQLCAMSFRWRTAAMIFNLVIVLVLISLIAVHPRLEQTARVEWMMLSAFSFLVSYMLSDSKTRIMAHMRLNRDVLLALAHKTENALFITDMNGIIQDFNNRALEIFGYDEHDLTNRDFKMLRKNDLTQEEIEKGLKCIHQNLFWTSEAILVHKEGKEIVTYISIGKIVRGEMNLLVYRVRDLTHEIKGQQDLVKARDEARAAAEAKSRFVATMSHEIRTPLNGVIGMTNLLSETKLDERQKDLLETIQKSGQNLMVLINDILDFSKMESGKMQLTEEVTDVRELISDTIYLLHPHAGRKGLHIYMNVSMDVPERLTMDTSRLRQVLLNLVGNAVKFTEKGSVQVCCTATRPKSGFVSLRFEVEDSGIGIPKDKMEGLFEAFYQVDVSTSRKYGGTGLGLAITKQIIEMMGGHISVQSREGEGSRFIVEIPGVAIVEGHSCFKPPEEAWDMERFSDARILIAEDNLINQKVLQYMLQSLGLNWDVVANGSEAVDFCRENPVDVILMDVQMPVMDGLEATRILRREGFTPYIIALTANHSVQDKQLCMDAGMDEFVSKPFIVSQLKEALVRWVDR